MTKNKNLVVACPYRDCGKHTHLLEGNRGNAACAKCGRELVVSVMTVPQTEKVTLLDVVGLYEHYSQEYYCASWLHVRPELVGFKEFLKMDLEDPSIYSAPEERLKQEHIKEDIDFLKENLPALSSLLTERRTSQIFRKLHPGLYAVGMRVREAFKHDFKSEYGLDTIFSHVKNLDLGTILPATEGTSAEFTATLSFRHELADVTLRVQVSDITDQDEYQKAEAAIHPLNNVAMQVARNLRQMCEDDGNMSTRWHALHPNIPKKWVMVGPDTNTFEIEVGEGSGMSRYLVSMTGVGKASHLTAGQMLHSMVAV